jgi:hypothetical protein
VHNLFSKIAEGGADYKNAGDAHKNAINSLGVNVNFGASWYESIRALRDAALKQTRSSESDMNEINDALKKFLKDSDDFYNSQKGLENFATDQSKKDDPFLADFYQYYADYVANASKLAKDPEFVNEFFSEETEIVFAKFLMVVSKVVDRATALEAAAAAATTTT